MDFQEVWQKADQVYGAFSCREANRLYDLGMTLPDNCRIVEVGCYGGKSSIVLGLIAKQKNGDLTCIDSFITGMPDIKNVEKYFRRNMDRFKIDYTLLEKTSEQAAKSYRKKIDLVFIDGDHRYEGVELDCKLWIPKLRAGGWIVFHDYVSSWSGVKQAVDERTDLEGGEIIESSIFKRKPAIV